MNKKVKKLLAIAVALLLVLPVISILANAEDDKGELCYAQLETVRMAHAPEDTFVVEQNKQKARAFYSFNGSGSYLFYSNLNATQKEIYNDILASDAGLNSATTGTVAITLPSALNIKAASETALGNAIRLNVFAALSALIDDYPEYFWIDLCSFSYSYYSGSTYTLADLDCIFDISETGHSSWSAIRSLYNGLLNSVANFKIKGTSRYEKLKSIHDQICAQVTYSTDVNNPISHQAISVFNSPYNPVCEGYSEAFKLLCDREGIPCIIVTGLGNGGAHEWNYVQMEDGKWYGMDVTWDDQENIGYLYDYFLTGTTTQDIFNNDTFSTSHVTNGIHFPSVNYALTYPSLATVSYVGANVSFNATATFNNTNGFMYIPKGAVLNEQFIGTYTGYTHYKPSDQTVSITGGSTTGATVSITNTNSSSKTYTVVRWGDVNATNSVNSTDYTTAKNVVKGSGTLSGARFAAGDFNGDGVIDAFDMYYLDKYIRE